MQKQRGTMCYKVCVTIFSIDLKYDISGLYAAFTHAHLVNTA